MTGIVDLGNACPVMVVGRKQMNEFFMSKNRSRRTLKNEIIGTGRKNVRW